LTVTLLELDGVTRRYGALVALDEVAMSVEEGEVRAIIGPNGAGKTTLFNVITGTVKPTAGRIRFADQPIAGLASHQICRLGISRTFQITALFPEISPL
jgi:branched-chain amino acid transport system ATP-binding protein